MDPFWIAPSQTGAPIYRSTISIGLLSSLIAFVVQV
jgi:hypothetical protein